MLDKDRIRLMNKMSIYEKNYRDDFKIADYYRKIMQVLRDGLH